MQKLFFSHIFKWTAHDYQSVCAIPTSSRDNKTFSFQKWDLFQKIENLKNAFISLMVGIVLLQTFHIAFSLSKEFVQSLLQRQIPSIIS